MRLSHLEETAMNRPAQTAPCSAAASRCPNAQACSLWDQYGPDCEAGAVMPKCLVSIHQELAVLTFLLRAAAGPEAIAAANRRLRDGP
jgi:hypothetical protein